MAIGDSGNDQEMLMLAKYSIAMRDADPSIHAIARHVTTLGPSLGVGEAIMRYKLGIGIVNNGKSEFNLLASSQQHHAQYGGIVPEVASREHEHSLGLMLKQLADQEKLANLDLIAYAAQPGLPGALHVGKVSSLTQPYAYPLLALVASGGHTRIYEIGSATLSTILYDTRDDAIGEAFDKVGRLLGLAYPGGPAIDALHKPELATINFGIDHINED
ncbi:unnamed protein product [Didymodactylos carnosus]|uniref:Gcp-like domain-containing protein n=1 Tax=Didymodactylos carnosus TaxID=1234261 RepID=A0A8S2CMH2_9BILA|nr:unnamed protein product [Didymodactylos carnosus]CAF3492042.1 unnamed protein product [Didymodactylos carnosus]